MLLFQVIEKIFCIVLQNATIFYFLKQNNGYKLFLFYLFTTLIYCTIYEFKKSQTNMLGIGNFT